MSTAPGRLGVGVVGAGRVGAVLGSALRAAGHAVVGASGISAESRERIATMLPGVPALEVPAVVERAELVLLTVPDDALADLVAGLARVGAWQPGQIVVHTAGALGTDVLGPARAAGAIPLAIHPAMTFTGTSLDLRRLVGCSFAVTGPGPVLPIGQALVVEIGGEPVVVAEEARPLYHAALAHGANHLVVLVAQAVHALTRAGVDQPDRVLGPLLSAALDSAVRSASTLGAGSGGGPVEALTAAEVAGVVGLTGPVVRGDAGTVAAHLAQLAALGVRDPSAADIPAAYRALARSATTRALAGARITPAQAERLLDVLAEAQPQLPRDPQEDGL
ncbi:MAG: oxidoreductase [Actinotalea sp.]|nr:oxidoreductase [Actinotalea sp.]